MKALLVKGEEGERKQVKRAFQKAQMSPVLSVFTCGDWEADLTAPVRAPQTLLWEGRHTPEFRHVLESAGLYTHLELH